MKDGNGGWVEWDPASETAGPRLSGYAADGSAVRRDSVWVLLTDGYVANRDSLLEALGGSLSRSTCEWVADAIEAWGPQAAATAIAGPCSWVAWRPAEGCLYASVDRFGQRPLYWVERGSRLRIAVRSFPLSGLEDGSGVDLEAVAAHLYGLPPSPATTFFRDVRAIPAGSQLRVRHREVDIRRWWSLAPPPGDSTEGLVLGGRLTQKRRLDPAAPDTWARDLEALLTRVVAEHAGADGGSGVTLSAGSDSTAVAAAWRRSLPDSAHPLALLWAFPDLPAADESGAAAVVADHLGLDPVTVAPERHWPFALDAGVLATEERPTPFGFVEIWEGALRIASARGLNTLLTGSGGDQVFGAGEYFSYAELILSGRVAPALRRWAGHRRRAGVGAPLHAWRWLLRPLLAALLPRRPVLRPLPWAGKALRELAHDLGAPASTWWLPRPASRSRRDSLDAGWLAPSLVDLAQRGASWGVECRHPLLDHRLVEWVVALPAASILWDGQRKGLLRAAMAPLLPPPEAVRLRKARLETLWHKGVRLERPRMEAMLHEPISVDLGWVDGDALRHAVATLASERPDPRLWPVLTLEAWLRRHLG